MLHGRPAAKHHPGIDDHLSRGHEGRRVRPAKGMMNRNIDYRSHGVPLNTCELTRQDHRDQRQADDISAHVEKEAAKWRAEEAADPDLREARLKNVRRAWDII